GLMSRAEVRSRWLRTNRQLFVFDEQRLGRDRGLGIMQELAEREAILGETNLASKLTRSHLDMFTLKLSMPSAHSFAICCHSGATSAAPAYAASMCTHIRCHSFFSCSTALISAKQSTAQVFVVPIVVAR